MAGNAQVAGNAAQPPANALNPAFVNTQGTAAEGGAGFWKGRNYDFLINGIDVGDVDKDGMQEVVVAAPQKILIYRFAQQRQQTIAEIDAGAFIRNISVSVADINGNGTPEIFVTAFSSALNSLESYVLEFDGKTFRKLLQKSHYYYSVVHRPGKGALLLGQLQNSDTTVYSGPIVEMEWKGGDYVPGRQILPARKANLLGLTYGNIMNDDS